MPIDSFSELFFTAIFGDLQIFKATLLELELLCRVGCDGILDGAHTDMCGKCGGDGSTCVKVKSRKNSIPPANRKKLYSHWIQEVLFEKLTSIFCRINQVQDFITLDLTGDKVQTELAGIKMTEHSNGTVVGEAYQSDQPVAKAGGESGDVLCYC